jgi:putative ABC transport system permease protein
VNDPRSFGAALARAWRSLKRTPGFMALGVVSLAIALGLATTVIAQIDALTHPYVSLRDVHELFRVQLTRPTATPPLPGEISDVLNKVGPFAGASTAELRGREWVESGAYVGMSTAMAASRELFDLLGARTRLGRLFRPDETTQSGVAVVSDEFWKNHHRDRATLDTATLTYGGAVYRIVGVLQPHVSVVSWSGDIWFPAPHTRFTGIEVHVVRLKSRASRADAEQALVSAAAELGKRHGAGYRGQPAFDLVSLAPDPLGLGEFHRALLGAAVFILLIACANVGALMLARAVARRRDYALRLALGASRANIVTDITAEVAIIAVLGGIAGVLIAQWTMHIMIAATPTELSWFGFLEPRWNYRVFLGMFAVVAIAIVLAAIVPALHVTRIAPADPLKEGSGALTGRPTQRFQLLIMGELALAMVLLLGASLISKSASRVAAFDFGYDGSRVTRVSAEIPVSEFPSSFTADARRASISRARVNAITEQLRGLPGVRGATWSISAYWSDFGVTPDVHNAADTVRIVPDIQVVGSGFFETLGIPIARGRDFVASDAERGAIILDELSAQRLFPGTDPVGRTVGIGSRQRVRWVPVIGVVAHATHGLPEHAEMEPEATVYASDLRLASYGIAFIVRGDAATGDVAPLALRLVRSQLPPQTPVSASAWLAHFNAAVRGRRFIAGIFIVLSAASLALATAGLFGVLAYASRQRMREFGLRIALGAQRVHIARLVLRDGLVMALGGTALGAGIGMWAAFVVYMMLWGVYPVDVGALLTAEAILLTVTLAAATVPAIQSTRANPVDVMRAT